MHFKRLSLSSADHWHDMHVSYMCEARLTAMFQDNFFLLFTKSNIFFYFFGSMYITLFLFLSIQ